MFRKLIISLRSVDLQSLQVVLSHFEEKIWLWIFSEFSIYDSSQNLKLQVKTWNLFRKLIISLRSVDLQSLQVVLSHFEEKIWLWIFSEFSIYDSSQNLKLQVKTWNLFRKLIISLRSVDLQSLQVVLSHFEEKIWLWIFSEFSIYDSSQNLKLQVKTWNLFRKLIISLRSVDLQSLQVVLSHFEEKIWLWIFSEFSIYDSSQNLKLQVKTWNLFRKLIISLRSVDLQSLQVVLSHFEEKIWLWIFSEFSIYDSSQNLKLQVKTWNLFRKLIISLRSVDLQSLQVVLSHFEEKIWLWIFSEFSIYDFQNLKLQVMKFVQKTHYLTQICWFTIIASGFESFWRKNLTLNFFGIFDLRFKSKSKVAGKNMKFVQKTHYLTQICWFTIIASGFESFWRKNLTLNFFGIFDLRFKSKSKVAGKNMKFVQKTHYLTQICWFTIIASGFESFWRKNLTLNFFGIFDLRFKSKSKVAGKNMKFVQKTHYLTQICWFTIIASGFESFWRKNLTLNFFGIFDLRFKSVDLKI